MKRILLSLGAAVCAAASAFSASVTGIQFEGSGGTDVMSTPQILVTTEGSPAVVYADWWEEDSPNNKVRVFLTGTGNNWAGFFPVNHAGRAHYVLWAETAAGVATNYQERSYPITEISGATVTDARGLTNQRYPDMTKWSTEGGTGNLDANWYGVLYSRDRNVPQTVKLPGTTITNNPALNGQTAGGFVRTRSKVFDGVGSIWFKARMPNLNAADGKLAIDRITSTGSGIYMNYRIAEVAEVSVPASTAGSEWQQFHLIFQDYPSAVADRAYYRIRNKTMSVSAADKTTNTVEVCDIVLAPIIPQVEVYKDQADYGPAGFPSVMDPVEFHVAVSNLYPAAPAQYITPRLVWRQKTGLHWDAWHEAVMTNVEGRAVQDDGTYACVLAVDAPDENRRIKAGAFEYFYEVSYTGYTPKFPSIKYNGEGLNHIVNDRFDWGDLGTYHYLTHTNILALYMDATGTNCEARAPAYWPSLKEQVDFFTDVPRGEFTDYAYDLGIVPGSAAEASWWGFTHKFDVRDLDEGWPVAQMNYSIYDDSDGSVSIESEPFEIEDEFHYLKPLASDGIRRFRTANDSVALAVEDVDEDIAPSYLEHAYEMMNVGDYTWSAIVHVTNAVDAYMFPTSANHHVAGRSYYNAGPYQWLETDQDVTAINPPTSGRVKPVVEEWTTTTRWRKVQATDSEGHPLYDQNGKPVWARNEDGSYVTNAVQTSAWVPDFDEDTGFEEEVLQIPDAKKNSADTKAPRIQIDYDGFLMFRFCTTNGEYQVRRAAWQDFNDWAADINYFSRSYGLYDMNVFESDANDLEDTTYGAMVTRTFQTNTPDPDDPAGDPDTTTRFADGMAAKNAWIEQDRTITAVREGSSQTGANKSVRLSTLPSAPGTLDTTIFTKADEGGRGTISFRARASAVDTIAEYYDAGRSWTEGYCAFALVNVSSLSDSTNASVSVYANWSDENNWIEARLVQRCRYEAASGAVTPSNAEASRKNYLTFELWECVNGVQRRLDAEIGTQNQGNMLRIDGKRVMRHPSGSGDDGSAYSLDNANGWVIELAVNGTTVDARLFRGVGGGHAKNGFLAATAGDPAYSTGGRYDYEYQNNEWRLQATTTQTKKGTVAFNATEAAATFRPYVIPYTTYSGLEHQGLLWPQTVTGADAFNAVFNAADSAWRRSTDRFWGYMDPWKPVVAGGSGVAYPSTLERPAPKAYFRILAYRTDEEDSGETVAPVPTNLDDWDDHWDEIGQHANDGIATVEGFAWQELEIPMKLWDDTFVRIQALAYSSDSEAAQTPANRATGSLTVDDVGGLAWLGKTIYDKDYGTTANLLNSWIGTYATIVEDGRDEHKWALVRSRANPNKSGQPGQGESLPVAYTNMAQAVTTPRLADGVGDIMFTYWAEDADVAFAVEAVNERTGALIDDSVFSPVVKTAFVGQASTSLYVPALYAGISGRLRVRTLSPAESGLDERGTLYLDDLRATDYPNTGDTSWEAYNALISTFQTSADDTSVPAISTKSDAKFDLANATYRSAVLNDRKDHDTPPPDVEWRDHVPYVQTPSIETGVGEVSFWYRRAPGETEPGRICLLVAKASQTPDNRWVPLTEDDLNTNLVWNADAQAWEYENADLERERAALAALTNVTSDAWTYFSAEFYQKDNNILRIYSGTNWSSFATAGTGNGRVMIDNVLITEPVRASIDVGEIEFIPGVPVCTQDTMAKIRLVNPRMNPYNIKVYLDWYADVTPPGRAYSGSTFDVIEAETNRTVEVVAEGIEIVYTTITYTTNTYSRINETKIPDNLAWTYAEWANKPKGPRTHGTLEFVQSERDPYLYYSTNAIPTTKLDPDTIVQYCARVEYRGRFSSPIVSETQGRVQNGFWFENPEWYEPIDLNEMMGTTNQPVAHFWNFSVSTNEAFFNEIRPTTVNVNNRRQQFVELIGRNGGSLKDWTIHHVKLDDLYFPMDGIYQWTNELEATAAFKADGNQTSNKGWGFYVLGCSGVSRRDEELFPAAAETDSNFWGQPNMYVRGGLMLKRGMGAWADRVCWATGGKSEVANLVDEGYTYIGQFLWRNNYIYAVQEASVEGKQIDWTTTSGSLITPGAYNIGEEDAIWSLTEQAVETVPPLLDAPVITGFSVGTDTIAVSFAVSVTNETALAADDWTWYLQYTDDLETDDEFWSLSRIEDVEVTADGDSDPPWTWSGTTEIDYDPDTDPDVRFFRVKAYPKGE